jgi:aldehyde:ferredoxin oxidoreductase
MIKKRKKVPMTARGYAGRVARVDLTRGTVEKVPLDMDMVEKFIGPEGISFRWAYDLIPAGLDPFDEAFPVIIGSGPIVGAPVPGSSRVCALFKHPNSAGVIENSHAGGHLGPMLKWAGYDYLIISGKSPRPVYIAIKDEEIGILDGSAIWGKDLYETTDLLWEKHENGSVLAIGPAGERLVRATVALVDKVHSLGKGGLPAVMGSKKLKAVVISGTKGIRIADPEALKRLIVPMVDRIKNHPNRKRCIELGSMVGFPVWFERMGASQHNWTSTLPVNLAFERYGTEVYKRIAQKDRVACFACPAGCKDHLRVREGEFAGMETFASSLYGRLENFVARCNVGSFNRFAKCMDLCQRMGLCVHEMSAMIDWAVDLFKNGIISKKDTDGLSLEWDFETTVRLLEQAALNEGFGAVLGSGMLRAIERIGRGSDKFAIHIKGMSPLYDARINRLGIAEFGQVVNPKGAHQGRAPLPALYLTRDLPDAVAVARAWCKKEMLPEDAVNRIFDSPGRFNIARLAKWTQERRLVFNSLGIGCSRERSGNSFSIEEAIEIYRAVTGLTTSADELHLIGSRCFTLLKALNLREGFTRKDDRFPARWFEAASRHGESVTLEDYFGKKLTPADCEKMLDDYYDENKWDIAMGAPNGRRLSELGLGRIAEDLKASGYLQDPNRQ